MSTISPEYTAVTKYAGMTPEELYMDIAVFSKDLFNKESWVSRAGKGLAKRVAMGALAIGLAFSANASTTEAPERNDKVLLLPSIDGDTSEHNTDIAVETELSSEEKTSIEFCSTKWEVKEPQPNSQKRWLADGYESILVAQSDRDAKNSAHSWFRQVACRYPQYLSSTADFFGINHNYKPSDLHDNGVINENGQKIASGILNRLMVADFKVLEKAPDNFYKTYLEQDGTVSIASKTGGFDEKAILVSYGVIDEAGSEKVCHLVIEGECAQPAIPAEEEKKEKEKEDKPTVPTPTPTPTETPTTTPTPTPTETPTTTPTPTPTQPGTPTPTPTPPETKPPVPPKEDDDELPQVPGDPPAEQDPGTPDNPGEGPAEQEPEDDGYLPEEPKQTQPPYTKPADPEPAPKPTPAPVQTEQPPANGTEPPKPQAAAGGQLPLWMLAMTAPAGFAPLVFRREELNKDLKERQ